jgi:membrane-bound lytic murein transglycosylase B
MKVIFPPIPQMTRHRTNRYFLAVIFIFLFNLSFISPTHAQTPQCNTPAEKQACQDLLKQVEAEQAQAQQQLIQAQGQSTSLSQAVAVLAAKIKSAQLDIKAKNLLIQTLGNNIQDKNDHIINLDTHIEKGKQTLSDLLRKTREIDQYSLPEVLLSQSTVAGFFKDVDAFDALQDSLQKTFNTLRADKASTTAEKDALTVRQNRETDARYAIQQQEKNIQADQIEQKQLLSISKGNEKAYTSLVAQKVAAAGQIRAALFNLAGANAIKFGDAYNYALMVSKQTGVPPAFLLAIVTQESNLGSNVGQCYLSDPATGNGVNVKSGKAVSGVMKPSRDVQPFLSITKDLGVNPYQTPVSCPLSYGYGGAMGPAQFIPSTWILSDFNTRVQHSLGISSMPNPWNPFHAFMAAGIYLADLGANSSSYSAQKNAACKYYSGKSCGYATGNTSYGASVLNLAYFNSNSIQSKIDQL